MADTPLRRLLDLPGVAELETKALMKPQYADPDAREHFPDIDECSLAAFGLTADDADAVERPAGWDRIERRPEREQVAAFEAEGWDVTDAKRRPLRMLGHLAPQLWLAIRGVAGELPFVAVEESDDGAAALAREAARFRRDRR
ncbi:MAG TPA: hypothetical protein VL460_06235 [Caulobacteraceae bacterium]|jgi:hypothetical protein|nr:hypothetical protein [Caulobacteraceae bacterium]